jgi:hypothetical protein
MIRRAQDDDVAHVASLVSDMEALECRAMGVTPSAGVAMAYQMSSLCAYTITRKSGEPWIMFGCSPAYSDRTRGHPWMIGGDRRPVTREVVGVIPAYVEVFQQNYPLLENYCHQDNLVSRRWLTRLGFEFDPQPKDFLGIPMVRFSRCVSPLL